MDDRRMNMNGDNSNELVELFGDALINNDAAALRDTLKNIAISSLTEGLGARLMAQDFFTETKINLERLREKGDSGAGLRNNIKDFLDDVTKDEEEVMDKLAYYLEKPDDTTMLDPSGTATNKIKERADYLSDDEIVRFAQKIAGFPAHNIREDNPARWTTYWLPDTRDGIVEELQDIRQSYLEEGYSEATQREFAAAVKWVNNMLDTSFNNAIPENPWISTQ
jgi:hypothetical protein